MQSACIQQLFTLSACITAHLHSLPESQHSFFTQSAYNYTLMSVFEFILHDALGGLGGGGTGTKSNPKKSTRLH